MRKTFAKTIIELAEEDDKLVVLIGDISHYLLNEFERKFPDRFYNVGICEQTIMSMAAGMATEGLRPIVHTIAPFCVERAYEQIKVDLCYQGLDVTIVSAGGSFDYAHLGCTHHCYEDISILRPLPKMEIFTPGTNDEFNTLFKATWNNGSPKYYKMIADQHSGKFNVKPYECNVIKKGYNDIAVFVSGFLYDSVIESCGNSTVIYMSTITPLSDVTKKTISDILDSHINIIVVEENASIGSLGDQIFHVASEAGKRTKIKKIAIPNEFLEEYGKPEQHREKLGLTTKNIKKVIQSMENNDL